MRCRDYEEFIAALDANKVRYLVVGAHAVALHARPRATKDLDILIDPTLTNARRVLATLRDFFGGTDLGYTVSDILDPNVILQLGVAPVRIDLFSNVAGCSDFKAVWRNRVRAPFGAVEACYLGLEDLIRTKQATGRPQDRADLRVLQKARTRRGGTTRRCSAQA